MDHLSIIPSQFNLNSKNFAFANRFSLPANVKNYFFREISNSTLDSGNIGSMFGNGFFNFSKSIHGFSLDSINHGSVIGKRTGFGIKSEVFEEKNDGYYIRRCVEIARRAVGCTSPNPMVGCVIVKDKQVVGEGFHPKAGMPHAEVFALKDAGVLAENATAYVSLEPCNHYGRTPPCTEALIRAKVKRVVVGMVDPNPIVASKGVERLRESGIEVTVGVEEQLCRKLNEAYIHRMLTGKPFVTLRYSLSFNGEILNELGDGAQDPGGYYSMLLQEHDGIIIPSISLLGNSDFPVSQEPGANQPFKFTIADAPNFLADHLALSTEAPRLAVFTDKNTTLDAETESKLRQGGVEIVDFNRINLDLILDFCSQRGLCSVLMDLRGDGGDYDKILEQGLEKGLVQKVVIEVCPMWGGGEMNLVQAMKKIERKTRRLRDLQSRISKNSVVVEGYFC